MKDCKNIQLLLSDYIDGELPQESAWSVKLHLASCAVCARAAKELACTVSLLGGLPRVDTSASFEEALARRLADQVLQPRRPTYGARIAQWWALPRVRPAALATAGALAVVVPAAFVYNARPRHEPRVEPAMAASTEQPFVEQCLEEHAVFASGEPLGDPAAMLLASSAKDTGNAGGETSP